MSPDSRLQEFPASGGQMRLSDCKAKASYRAARYCPDYYHALTDDLYVHWYINAE